MFDRRTHTLAQVDPAIWSVIQREHARQEAHIELIASEISVGLPRDRIKALRAIEASGGEFITVSDRQIFAAVLELARTGGVFAEPGAAAAYAGALQQQAANGAGRSVVLITGSGLKDLSGLLGSGLLDPPQPVAAAQQDAAALVVH